MLKKNNFLKCWTVAALIAAMTPGNGLSEPPLDIQLREGGDARVSLSDALGEDGKWQLQFSRDLLEWEDIGSMEKNDATFAMDISSTNRPGAAFFRATQKSESRPQVQVRSILDPDPGSPRGMITEAGNMLSLLLPTGNEDADENIEKAIDRINQSLSNQLWFNDCYADSGEGRKVFNRVRQAIRKLEKVIDDDGDDNDGDDDDDNDDDDTPLGAAAKAEVQNAINLLVSAVRLLAQKNLELAIRSGGDPNDILFAESRLANGDIKAEKGNFRGAVNAYKRAWIFAGKAVKDTTRFPFAIDDSVATDEDSPLADVNVLANDFDIDGDTLSVQSIDSTATQGSVELVSGSIHYDPEDRFQFLAVNETAPDTFGYVVTDGNGGTDSATVAITVSGVNDPPVAGDQEVSTNGNPVTITLVGSDIDGSDVLSFAITSLPPTGTLADSESNAIVLGQALPDNIVIYDPGATDDFGTFTFEANDGNGGADTGLVTLNPAANPNPEPNQNPPGITDLQAIDGLDVETTVDAPVLVRLEGQGPDGTPDLTFSIVGGSGPNIGTLGAIVPLDPEDPADPILTADVIYTPNLGITGTDTFQFQISDGVNTVVGTKTIVISQAAVLEAPDAGTFSVGAEPDTPVEIDLQTGGVVDLSPQPRALVFNGAAIAGNVSDANDDGFGDGQDPLPGPAPILIAAGVDVNLGATPSGSVTDPAGDATNSPSDDPANPDLVSATVSSDGTNLTFQIRFVAAGFDASTSRGSFVVDIDENPATGFPGIDAANNDSSLMGTEFLVNIGANLGASADVLKFISLPNNFSTVGSFTATVLSDGYDVTIPLSTFDGDDGQVTYKVETQSFLGTGFTGILDYMPDIGLAPGQADVTGIQGTARINIEWDISSFDPDNLDNAEVVLNTKKGTVDLLDTSWHYVMADGDGLLSESDYEATPVDPTPLAVMPVIDGPTGTEGIFRFEVTDELRDALESGFSFFVIQGRVDESLTGGGFKRGLQVRSTATGNLGSMLEPLLEVTEPDPPAETFTITTLPLNGTLTDSSGFVINTVPTVLTNQMVTFTPDPELSFSTSFEYEIQNAAGISVGTVVLRFGAGCDVDIENCDDGRVPQ